MKRKGFTLVEMLAVIAVLGILVIVVLPNVLKNFRDSKRLAFLDAAKVVYTKATDEYVLKRTQGKKIGLITNDNDNKLDLDNSENLEYTVRIDSEGQVTQFRLKNNEFCIVGVGDFLNDYKIDQIIDLSEVDGPAKCTSTNLVDNAIYILKLVSRNTTNTGYDPKTIYLKYNVGWYKEKAAKNLLNTNGNGEPMVTKPYLKDHYYKGAWATNMNGLKIKAIDCDGTVVADNTGSGIFTGNENTTYINAFSEFMQKYYIVSYVGGNNSTGSIAALKVPYGEEKRLPKNKDENGYGINIKKTGYLFTGWDHDGTSFEDEGILPVVTDDNENDYPKFKFDNVSVCSGNGDLDNQNIEEFEAQWQPVVYNITYDFNNGSGSGTYPTTGTYDSLVTVPNPTRLGYTFTGWTIAGAFDASTAKMGDTADANALDLNVSGTPTRQYYKNLSPLQDSTVTFKANWSTNTYAIAYDLETVVTVNPKPIQGLFGTTVEIGNALRTGYTFQGWTATGLDVNTAKHGTSNTPTTAWNGTTKVLSTYFLNLNSVDGNTVTFKSNWTANTYTVAYNCNNGTGTMNTSSHTYDIAKNLNENKCSRVGYTFLGWSTSNTATTQTYVDQESVTNLTSTQGATVTLYAVWKINTYTLTVKPNGGTWNGKTTEQTFNQNYNTTKTIANPTAGPTYTITYNANNQGATYSSSPASVQRPFTSWSLSGSGSLSGTTFTYGAGNATLTANYSTTSNSFTLPTITRTGYTCKWAEGSATGTEYTGGTSRTITSNKAYYAKCGAITYTVAYNCNGGTGTMSNSSHEFDKSKNLNENKCTRTGYSFLGWATSSGATSAAYADKASVTNLANTQGATVTLYAVWKINTYTLTVKPNGGTWSGKTTDQSFTQNYNTTRTIANPTAGPTYTITYNGNSQDATYTSSPTSVQRPFSSWTKSGSGTLSGTTFTYGAGDTTLTASYSTTSNSFTLPAISKTGHACKWAEGSTSGTQYAGGASRTITANKTYYAKCAANTYSVAYNCNGGTGTMSNSSHTYGVAKNLNENKCAKTGYSFLGWSTSSSASTATYTDKQSVSNLTTTQGATVTLYAVWKINKYTLTVKPNGGTWGGKTTDQTFDQNYNTTKTIANPTAGPTYTITYNGNSQGATYTGTPTSVQRPFSSWTKSGSGTLSGITFTYGAGNTTLTASYSTTSNSFKLPAISKSGYVCKWAEGSTSGTQYAGGTSRTVTGNKTYYAKCVSNKFTGTASNEIQTGACDAGGCYGILYAKVTSVSCSNSGSNTTCTFTVHTRQTCCVNAFANQLYLRVKNSSGTVVGSVSNCEIKPYTNGNPSTWDRTCNVTFPTPSGKVTYTYVGIVNNNGCIKNNRYQNFDWGNCYELSGTISN